jgi:hypothetical protein
MKACFETLKKNIQFSGKRGFMENINAQEVVLVVTPKEYT